MSSISLKVLGLIIPESGGTLVFEASVTSYKVKQSRYRPREAREFQEVRVPRFCDNGTGW